MATFFHVYDALVTPVFTAVWCAERRRANRGESPGLALTRDHTDRTSNTLGGGSVGGTTGAGARLAGSRSGTGEVTVSGVAAAQGAR